jgi:hypothetical protein
VPGDDCGSADNVDIAPGAVELESWILNLSVEASTAFVGRSKMSRKLFSRNRCYTICERIGDVIPWPFRDRFCEGVADLQQLPARWRIGRESGFNAGIWRGSDKALKVSKCQVGRGIHVGALWQCRLRPLGAMHAPAKGNIFRRHLRLRTSGAHRTRAWGLTLGAR